MLNEETKSIRHRVSKKIKDSLGNLSSLGMYSLGNLSSLGM
jgi:hypothetical protein